MQFCKRIVSVATERRDLERIHWNTVATEVVVYTKLYKVNDFLLN